GGRDVRRHILQHDRAACDHGMGPDTAILVDTDHSTQHGEVVDHDMACQLGQIRKSGVVPDHAVVCNVHIGHDPVPVADAGDTAILDRTPIDGAVLADGIAIADLEPGRLAAVFFVLWYATERTEGMNSIVAADYRAPLDHGVRTDHGARA